MKAKPRSPAAHTRRYATPSIRDLEVGSRFIFAADSTEQRGHLPLWDEVLGVHPECCNVVTQQEPEQIQVSLGGTSGRWISLRDEVLLGKLLAAEKVYMDVSGLGHHVWAPLLRVLLSRGARVRVVYAEPLEYRAHPSPASPTVFDLSVDFHGLAPLPGMARLAGPVDESRSILVAFLGFEGTRAMHIAMQLDPPPRIIPVVGVPGFRIEYPAFSVACNRQFLAEFRAHQEIRWARASCPFEAIDVLAQLHHDFPGYYLYIAPVGTKPHAVGAVKYAIDNPEFTEILYDHPIRKQGRTKGIGLVHVYDLGKNGR